MHKAGRNRLGSIAILSVTLALFAELGQPALAGGWVQKAPINLVTPESGCRNHVFYVGDPVAFKLAAKDLSYFEVRDYWGELIDKGPAAESIAINAKLPGWYKLYIHGKPLGEPKAAAPAPTTQPTPEELWGDIVGGTTFVILRKNANFPSLPAKDASGGSHGALDQVMRGVTGMGPQRHKVEAAKPDETIKNLSADVAIDKQLYLPFDPVRKRVLLGAFANGTKDLEGVRRIVERFKGDVQYWEPRNEPNYGSSGADFVKNELKPFYETVHDVDSGLKVLGPGAVSIGPQLLPWIEDFLKAGGAQYVDGFSYHAYNNVNGDVWLARKSLDSLTGLLKKYDADKLEKWQTEQGFFACVYGAYQPRLQGRWTMVEMMVFEQYGVPKEHNHLWYDKSHGFWDFPTWWENDDGGLNPAAPLMRVWSEELFGAKFAKAYDFGPAGNKLYVGSLFSGPNRQVAAFLSAGSTDGQVELKVQGAEVLKLVSAFGVEQDLPVKQGRATLSVPELPVYVELGRGQTIEVVPTAWGENLALASGVKVSSSGAAEHPLDKTIKNEPSKVVNGELENWYWSQQKDAQPWMSNVEKFPAWVEIALAKPEKVSRVVVFAAPPWQWQGSLLDYELQYDKDGQWVTLEHLTEPAKTFAVYTPPTRTSADSFYSDRWIFRHEFPAVTTGKLRLLVHEVTWGGGATQAVVKAGGQTGPHQIMLRELEVYSQ